jgi:hypothetical protein
MSDSFRDLDCAPQDGSLDPRHPSIVFDSIPQMRLDVFLSSLLLLLERSDHHRAHLFPCLLTSGLHLDCHIPETIPQLEDRARSPHIDHPGVRDCIVPFHHGVPDKSRRSSEDLSESLVADPSLLEFDVLRDLLRTHFPDGSHRSSSMTSVCAMYARRSASVIAGGTRPFALDPFARFFSEIPLLNQSTIPWIFVGLNPESIQDSQHDFQWLILPSLTSSVRMNSICARVGNRRKISR